MSVQEKTVPTEQIAIFVPHRQVDRMLGLHFRRHESCAGNFDTWQHPKDVIRAIREDLQAEVMIAVEEGDTKTRSIEIEYPSYVGWASVIENDPAFSDSLQDFQPNKRSTAKRLIDRTILAPLTKTVTIVYRVVNGHNGLPAMQIFSMYPGPDIGALEGDITEREGVVFMDWSHPGE